MLLDKIEEPLKEVSALTAKSADDMKQFRLKHPSGEGEINMLISEFHNMAADQKKIIDMKINELKQSAQDKINELKDQLETSKTQNDDIDLTRTAYPINLGTRHPLTLVKNGIIDTFARIGSTSYQGPEIDNDQHVFTMLDFTADHPACDIQDTFFIERSSTMDVTKSVLLRSRTSNGEACYMSTHGPSTHVLCPGRVYCNEAILARAHCFFHQVEGLYVDKNVSFADLKQVLLIFAHEMFGADTEIRLRPSYFSFIEPSTKMDISCNICGGEDCDFRKHTRWVGIPGRGMADPHGLEAYGIDSSVYTGYTFGMGIECIANLKCRVSDLRPFSENDIRLLREFEGAQCWVMSVKRQVLVGTQVLGVRCQVLTICPFYT